MMSPPASDYLVERRSFVRKISFWRAVALSLALVAVIAIGARVSGLSAGPSARAPHVARVAIEGVIVADRATLDLLRDVGKSAATGVLLTINSPGGTTTGSERLYDEIRKLAAKKPVVAVVGDAAASGAYIAALGADHIVAYGNSLVGSIGVLFQIPNVAHLLDKVGVEVEQIKSSPLKAAPNGLTPTSPEAKQAINALVKDSYAWFKDLVKDRRRMTDDEINVVSDGRVFTGRQGVDLKLVDSLGGETEAIAWLERDKGVAKNLPVKEWKKKRTLETLGLWGAASALASAVGLLELSETIARAGELLDVRKQHGLVSVWGF